MKLSRRQFLHLIMGLLRFRSCRASLRRRAIPARPIRLVVPFRQGEAFDAVGRPLADKI